MKKDVTRDGYTSRARLIVRVHEFVWALYIWAGEGLAGLMCYMDPCRDTLCSKEAKLDVHIQLTLKCTGEFVVTNRIWAIYLVWITLRSVKMTRTHLSLPLTV